MRRAAVAARGNYRLQGLTHIGFCRFNRFAGNLEASRIHGRYAVRLLDKHGTREDSVQALIYLGSTEGVRAEFDEAERLYMLALRRLDSSRNRRLVALAHWGLGSSLNAQECFERANEHLRIAVELGTGVFSLRENGAVRHTLTLSCRELGHYDQALSVSTEALGLLQCAGQAETMTDHDHALQLITARRGDRNQARSIYESIVSAQAVNEVALTHAAEACRELARLDMEEGEFADALQKAMAAVGLARRLRSEIDRGRAWLVLGQALMSLNRQRAAVTPLQRACAVFEKFHLRQSSIVASELLRMGQ